MRHANEHETRPVARGFVAGCRGGSRVWKGRVHFAKKIEAQKNKGHSNNGCPLPNVFTIYKDLY